MKKWMVLVLLVSAMPLLAQDRDMNIAVFASQADMQGENDFGTFNGRTDFEEGVSMGISINRYFGRFLALEASVFNLRNDAALQLDESVAVDLGNVSLTPVMIGAQFHILGRRRIDPYVGAGAAYVLATDMNSPDLEAGGVGRIEVDDAFTYYIAAGLGVEIVGGLAVVAEARELQYEPATRSTVTGVERDLELSPRIYSLGVRFRF